MKQHSKLTHQETTQAEAQHSSRQTSLEFANVEELLRRDAAETHIPAALTRQVQEAAAALPHFKRPCWKQLFGR